jgi:hypothetical protein
MQQTDWARADAVALAVITAHHGVARIDAFMAAGLTRHQIAAIFRRGVIERPRNAWYVDPALPWRAKHAVRVGGVLSCTSAVESYGLPVPPDAHRLTHVLMPGNAPRARHHRDKSRYVVPGEDREVRLHWSVEDGTISGWRTSLVDALLLLADCVPEDWWIAAVDAALHVPRDGAPLMSAEEHAVLARRLPARLKPALARVNPLAGSCIETLLRLGMERRGIGPLVLQFSPHKHRFVDFLLPGKLIVEADGEGYHDPEKDRIRDDSFRSLGYTVLPFSYERIVFDLDGVLDEIEAALAALFIV